MMNESELRPINRRFRAALLTTAALVAVVVAAVTSNVSTPKAGDDLTPVATAPTTIAGQTTIPNQPLTASDQGVTATEIKIATFTIAKPYLQRLNLTDPMLEASVPAFAEAINKSGGINGRKWVPDLIEIADPTDASAVAQACRTAFVDHKVFAVVNALAYPGLAECAARNNRFATDMGFGAVTATSQELLDRTKGRYWIGGMTSERIAALWAAQIKASAGSNTKVAIIQRQDPEIKHAGEVLARELTNRGFPKPIVITASSDLSTAAVQITNGIALMRTEKAQLIIPLVPAVAVGIIQGGLDNAGFTPEKGYSFSSLAALDSADFQKFYKAGQMKGASGVSIYRVPDDPEQAECRAIYLGASPGARFSQSNADVCHIMHQFAAAARASGPNLTLPSLAAGYASLAVYSGNSLGAQSFSANKHWGADQVRILEFRNGVLHAIGEFRSDF